MARFGLVACGRCLDGRRGCGGQLPVHELMPACTLRVQAEYFLRLGGLGLGLTMVSIFAFVPADDGKNSLILIARDVCFTAISRQPRYVTKNAFIGASQTHTLMLLRKDFAKYWSLMEILLQNASFGGIVAMAKMA